MSHAAAVLSADPTDAPARPSARLVTVLALLGAFAASMSLHVATTQALSYHARDEGPNASYAISLHAGELPTIDTPVAQDRERYPQIRPTSGYGDPRIQHTGPGPGAGTDQEPERSSKLSARLALALTVVIGQLWGLTIVVDEWMTGDTGTAWWGAGFLVLSFLVVLGIWLIDPKDR